MRLKTFKKFRQDLQDHAILSWPVLDTTEDFDVENLRTLTGWLRKKVDLPADKAIFNDEKTNALIETIRSRILTYEFADTMIRILPAIMLSLVPLVFFDLLSYPVLPFICLASPLPYFFFLRQKKGRSGVVETFRFYLSDDLDDGKKDILVAVYDDIKDGTLELFTHPNSKVLREISGMCVNAKNSFLFLSEQEFHRGGIFLLGNYPVGKIVIERKSYTKDTRTDILSKKYLSTKSSLEETVKKIETALKKGKIPQLSPNKKARVKAMKFALRNLELWESEDRWASLESSPTLKEELISIFEPISKSGDTRSKVVPGEKLAENFIKFEDRPLENWLH